VTTARERPQHPSRREYRAGSFVRYDGRRWEIDAVEFWRHDEKLHLRELDGAGRVRTREEWARDVEFGGEQPAPQQEMRVCPHCRELTQTPSMVGSWIRAQAAEIDASLSREYEGRPQKENQESPAHPVARDLPKVRGYFDSLANLPQYQNAEGREFIAEIMAELDAQPKREAVPDCVLEAVRIRAKEFDSIHTTWAENMRNDLRRWLAQVEGE